MSQGTTKKTSHLIGSMTFGEKPREKKDQKKSEECKIFKQNICALLNSGGGSCRFTIVNENYNYHKDSLGNDLESGLRNLLNPELLQNFIQIEQCEKELFFHVKSWCPAERRAGLCALSSGLFKRSGTCALPIPPADVVDYFLKRWKQDSRGGHVYGKPRQFYDQGKAHLGQILNFGESAYVELKSFATENKLIQRLKETLPRYFSAFANTSGGFLFIGIDDKTKEVVGCGQGMTLSQLKEHIQAICAKAQTQAVHLYQCPKRQSSWSPEVKVFPVTAAEEVLKFIIAINITPFCCAVFEKDPESWELKGDDAVQIKLNDWLKRLERPLSVQDVRPSPPRPRICVWKKAVVQMKRFFSKMCCTCTFLLENQDGGFQYVGDKA